MSRSNVIRYSMTESWLDVHSEYFFKRNRFKEPSQALERDFYSLERSQSSSSSSEDSAAERVPGLKDEVPINQHLSGHLTHENGLILRAIRGKKASLCSDSGKDDSTQFFDSNSKCFSSKSSRSSFLTCRQFALDWIPRQDKEQSKSCRLETRPVIPPPKPPRLSLPPQKPPRRIKDKQESQPDFEKANCSCLSWFLKIFKTSSINSTAINSLNSELCSSNLGETANPGNDSTSAAPLPAPRNQREASMSSKSSIQSIQVPRPFERTHFGIAADDDSGSEASYCDGRSDINSEWSEDSLGVGIATPLTLDPLFTTPEPPSKLIIPTGTVKKTPECFKSKCNPHAIRQMERLDGLEHTRYKLNMETEFKPACGRNLLSAFDEVGVMRTAF